MSYNRAKLDTITDVAIFLPSLGGGGAERMGVYLANYFADNNLSTDLVVCDFSGPWRSLINEKVRVIDLHKKRVSTSLLALTRYLRRKSPRSLLSLLDRANVIAVGACWLASVDTRLVISQRSNLSASIANYRDFRSRVLYQIVPVVYSGADAIVGISKGVAADIVAKLAVPAYKVTAIYNPVLVKPITATDIDWPTHPWLDNKTGPVIVSVGRLTAAKNYTNLILAFALVKKEAPAKLIIVGEGERRLELETLVEKLDLTSDVLMPGFKPNTYPWIGKGDVFVLSSNWEGFGNVLVEAMACGTPIVSTNCPSGPGEILENGKWGRLVPIEDPEAMSNAILESLAKSERDSALIHALEFSVEKAARQYIEVLELETERII